MLFIHVSCKISLYYRLDDDGLKLPSGVIQLVDIFPPSTKLCKRGVLPYLSVSQRKCTKKKYQRRKSFKTALVNTFVITKIIINLYNATAGGGQ